MAANSAVRQALGVDPDGILGTTLLDAVVDFDPESYAEPLKEALREREASWQCGRIQREALNRVSGHWVRWWLTPVESRSPGRRVCLHTVCDITPARLAEQRLSAALEELGALSGSRESAREEERGRLARDIHDDLGQVLAVLKIEASGLARCLGHESGALQDKVASMGELIDAAIQAVREVSRSLRPQILDQVDLPGALCALGQEFSRHTGLGFECRCDLHGAVVDQQTDTAIFRICQEALTNVARHARATKVVVRLWRESGAVVLHVRDNGIGVDPAEARNCWTFGFRGMRERARSCGGEARIDGLPGRGTVIVVTIPLRDEEEQECPGSS